MKIKAVMERNCADSLLVEVQTLQSFVLHDSILLWNETFRDPPVLKHGMIIIFYLMLMMRLSKHFNSSFPYLSSSKETMSHRAAVRSVITVWLLFVFICGLVWSCVSTPAAEL